MADGSIPPVASPLTGYQPDWARSATTTANASARYINNPQKYQLPGLGVNVCAWPWNAANDLSKDASPAIQAAITRAAGAPVYIPRGQYLMASKITSSSPVYITGDGNGCGPGAVLYTNATILVPSFSNDNLFEITTGYSCVFRDFRIETQGAARPATAGAGIKIIGEGGQTNGNTKIQNVGFIALYRGVEFLRPAYPTISGCYGQGGIDSYVHMETSAGVEGSGGFINNNYFFGNSSMNALIRTKCGYVIISENELLSAKTGVLVQIANYNAGFIRIHDNTIENHANYGIAVYTLDGSTVGLVDIHDNEFSVVSNSGAFVSHIYFDENRLSGATTATSGTGATATVTFSGGYVFPVGSTVVVAGVTPAGYNGTYVVIASSAGSVSYANATVGVQTVAGTVSGNVNFIDGASVNGNETHSNLSLAGSKHFWLPQGKNLQVKDNRILELGTAGVNGIQFAGSAGNGLMAPVDASNNLFSGTFGLKYSVVKGLTGVRVVRVTHLTNDMSFAQLANEAPAANTADGTQIFVNDGTPGAVLAGGGAGSLAINAAAGYRGL